MFKKLKLIKNVLKLAKELKEIGKENDKTLNELKHFLDTAVILYPKLRGIISEIIELVKDNNNKKV